VAYRVLGIDPGSRITGSERLAEIYHGVREIIVTHGPQEIAIEEVFLARNPDSALKLGQARGVAIAASVAEGLAVHEYAARRVKQAVVGTGRASKEQVQHMVRVILRLPALRLPFVTSILRAARRGK